MRCVLVLLLLLAMPAMSLPKDECQSALTALFGLFQMLPDSALAFTGVFRTLCLQYEVEGTGVPFAVWAEGYKSHMAVNAMLSDVQFGFVRLLNAQSVPSSERALAQVNATCSHDERVQGKERYAAMLAQFANKVAADRQDFSARFSFYTNATFLGDAFATSTLLYDYGLNVSKQIA